MKRLAYISLVLFVISALGGCKRKPNYVLSQSKMAEVLADIHTAEVVVENDHFSYSSDSSKMMLKDAVFKSHGITSQDFDTSLVWYAHNIDKYIEIYDATIEILQARSSTAGSLALKEALSMAGDSVDVWAGSRYVILNSKIPSQSLSFDIVEDDNWMPGDSYTFRAKVLNTESGTAFWTFLGNYEDHNIDALVTSNTLQSNNWCEITFISDSTLNLNRLRGNLSLRLENNQDIWLDSISLIRKRVSPQTYNQRYKVKRYKEYIP